MAAGGARCAGASFCDIDGDLDLSQVAPVFDIVVDDVTNDGNADLYLVGNHFRPQPETGRMDGGFGLLMQGNGDGTFSPVEPAVSGLVLLGDTKASLAIDFNDDGLTDFVRMTGQRC